MCKPWFWDMRSIRSNFLLHLLFLGQSHLLTCPRSGLDALLMCRSISVWMWVRRGLVGWCAGWRLGLMLGLVVGWIVCFTIGEIPAAIAQSNTINYTSTDLTGRNFAGEDLNGGVFVAAEMRDANLQGANLKGAMFTKANLYGANLSDTDLTDALIDRVTLFKANLKNANLTGATLTSTIIQETDITNVDFTDALIDRYTVSLLCKIASGTHPITGNNSRESLGCKD